MQTDNGLARLVDVAGGVRGNRCRGGRVDVVDAERALPGNISVSRAQSASVRSVAPVRKLASSVNGV